MSEELNIPRIDFDEVVALIEKARFRAMRAANAELIGMYWDIGAYVSDKTAAAGWGKSVASDFSAFLRSRCPSAKGFFAQNIWRMKQFYETYRDKKLSPLVREISWTNNLLSLSS